MAETVSLRHEGAVGRIVINRPEVKNALNLEAILQLIDALEQSEKEPEIHVLVIQGTGGDFSAGGDIQDMLARRGKAVATAERLKAGLSRIVHLLTRHEKPIIARVDGNAVGAGAAIALACDILLATKKSKFGFPFVKVGLVPDTGSSYVLPRVVGLQAARRLLLTGELVDGAEARRLGLVTELVEDGPALDAAEKKWIDRFAALGPTAVRDAKRLLWQNLDAPLENALTQEAYLQGIRFTTQEHADATEAFLAKRGPKA